MNSLNLPFIIAHSHVPLNVKQIDRERGLFAKEKFARFCILDDPCVFNVNGILFYAIKQCRGLETGTEIRVIMVPLLERLDPTCIQCDCHVTRARLFQTLEPQNKHDYTLALMSKVNKS